MEPVLRRHPRRAMWLRRLSEDLEKVLGQAEGWP